jgi:hypothetical protein
MRQMYKSKPEIKMYCTIAQDMRDGQVYLNPIFHSPGLLKPGVFEGLLKKF